MPEHTGGERKRLMNKFESCHGCPDRTATCHGSCKGYQARVVKDERRRQDMQENALGIQSRIEYSARCEAGQRQKDDRKRRIA